MRHTEFWERMDDALGTAYSRSWADMQVMGELDGRTAAQALADGVPPRTVWRAVWSTLGLPASRR